MKITRRWRILLMASAVLGVMTMGVCGNRSPAEASALAQTSDNFTLTKTGDPATFSQAGDQISYTYTVTVDLSGANDLSLPLYNLSIADDRATVNCPRTSTVDFQDTFTCTSSYTVTEADVAAGGVTNKATASGSYEVPATGCCSCGDEVRYLTASASFTATLAEPAIELTKTGTPATFTGPGQQISYEYLVTNTGGTALTGPLGVTDDLVTVSCPSGDLAPGASLTCTASYTTTAADVAAGSITNHAGASIGEASASAEFTVDLEADPALGLTKAPDPTVFSSAGTLVIYDFTVTNTGNVTLDGPFELQDEMLDQQDCPDQTLEPGASLSCTGYYRVRESDLNDSIHNCARVRGYYLGGPVRSDEVCADVYYQEPPSKQGACDTDPNSFECFCEQNPGDGDCGGTN
jgi:large repetitive protein